MTGWTPGIFTAAKGHTLHSIRAIPADPALSGKGRGLELLQALSGKGTARLAGTFASLLETGGANLAGSPAAPSLGLSEMPRTGNVLPDGKLPGKISPGNTEFAQGAATPETQPIEAAVVLDAAAFGTMPVPVPIVTAAEPAAGPTSADDLQAAEGTKRPLPKLAAFSIDAAEVSSVAKSEPAPAPAPGKIKQTPPAPAEVNSNTVQVTQPAPAAKGRTPEATSQVIPPPVVQFSTREALGLAGEGRRPVTGALQGAAVPIGAGPSPEAILASIVPLASSGSFAADTAVQAPIASRDFEALIDRLSQAREAAHPGTARLSLAHAEFGQVNLRFDAAPGSSTGPGLAGNPVSVSVTMTSHDPDFAHAARTALAERAASTPEPVRNDSNPARGDSAAAGNGQPHSHAQAQHQASGNARSLAQHSSPEQAGDLPTEEAGGSQPNVRRTETRGLYA